MTFLLVDRIVEFQPGEIIRGIKHVSHEDFYLTHDASGRACFISSLIGETLGQLAAWNVMSHNRFTQRPVAGVVSSAKLFRPAYVGETLFLESIIDSLDDRAVLYHSEAKVNNEVIFSIEGALGPLLPMEDFIDPHLAKDQFNQINRPEDWTKLISDYSNSKTLDPEDKSGGVRSGCMNLMFDKILDLIPGESMVAQKLVSKSAPYFPDHFPRKPVLPMTILLECKINLAHYFLEQSGLKGRYEVAELRRIKMNDFVYPGDLIQTQIKMKEKTESQLIISFRSEVLGQRVCVLELVLNAKG